MSRFVKIAKGHYSIHLSTGEKIGEAIRDHSRREYIPWNGNAEWFVVDMDGKEHGPTYNLSSSFSAAYEIWREKNGLAEQRTTVTISI